MNWKKYMAGIAGMLFLLTGSSGYRFRQKKRPGSRKIYTPGQRYLWMLTAGVCVVCIGKEEQVVRPMASTTKIMTCILALEEMEEGETGTVSANAAGQPKVRLGVKEGRNTGWKIFSTR